MVHCKWRLFVHFLCYTLLTMNKCINPFYVNTLRPRQDGRHFPDDILKCIFLNENVWILLRISLKCVRKVRSNNIPSLVQIMAWRRPGDKPLSETMMVSLLTHICVTRPQWVNKCGYYTPRSTKLKGGILVAPCPTVCLSVRMWTESCPLCIFNNTCRIHFIFTHSI